MISQELVEATVRSAESRGKNEARRLRASGKVPAVVYGAKKDSVAVAVDPKQIRKILHSESGHNTIFDLDVNGERSKVMIVDWQNEPIKGTLLHIDMKRIAMDQKMTVSVPIHLTGVPEGVKTQGGILDQVMREVQIECLPADIPSHLGVDVSHLAFGEVLRVADLPHSDKLNFLTDETQTVAHVTHVKETVVETPVVEGEVAAAPAEPEVIKKGKQDEEGTEKAEKSDKAEKKDEKKAEKKDEKKK